MLYNFFSDNFEYDECTAKGSCSIPPSISALQEVIVICLRQLAYYVLKLKDFGQDCSVEEQVIIQALSTVISSTDYNDEQLLSIVSKVYYHLVTSRQRYTNLCSERGVECKDLKSALNITPQMNLSQIMTLGEKAFLTKYKKVPRLQKNMSDILLAVIKSVALNSAKLSDYSVDLKKAVYEILTGLNFLNRTRISIEKCKKHIKLLADIDMQLLQELAKEQNSNYGPVSLKKVSLSTTKGKAILVSGESLFDLNKVLEAVNGKDIDVYTHDELIIAHAFEKFSKNENLKGHYGTCNENCILDFATFPGAILLTRNSNINTEYLYRGRLFTTSDVLPKGVIHIKENNFSGLIESAENAKGFAKGHNKTPVIIGYDPGELDNKIRIICEKFNSNEIKHLIILGLGTSKSAQQDYFNKFVSKLTPDVFVISFSYNNAEADNFLHINISNNRPLVYDILKHIFSLIPANSPKITFFLTKCDITSVSNMINLREKGVKNIYLTQCPPNLINPAVLSSLFAVYGIKSTSTPEADIDTILQ